MSAIEKLITVSCPACHVACWPHQEWCWNCRCELASRRAELREDVRRGSQRSRAALEWGGRE